MKLFNDFIINESEVPIKTKVSEFETFIRLNFPVEYFHIEYNKFNKSLYLSGIEVKTKYQGYGIGTKIMKELIDFSCENEIPILLNPQSDNVKDLKRLYEFYKKLGFVKNKESEYSGILIKYP